MHYYYETIKTPLIIFINNMIFFFFFPHKHLTNTKTIDNICINIYMFSFCDLLMNNLLTQLADNTNLNIFNNYKF